jgi:hypothetical protein
MTKLAVTFRNFADAPKNSSSRKLEHHSILCFIFARALTAILLVGGLGVENQWHELRNFSKLLHVIYVRSCESVKQQVHRWSHATSQHRAFLSLTAVRLSPWCKNDVICVYGSTEKSIVCVWFRVSFLKVPTPPPPLRGGTLRIILHIPRNSCLRKRGVGDGVTRRRWSAHGHYSTICNCCIKFLQYFEVYL